MAGDIGVSEVCKPFFPKKSPKIYFVLDRTSKAISLKFQYVPSVVETILVGGTMTVKNRTST